MIGSKHLLIQLWINKVTAEMALLNALNTLCCHFSTWNTSVPCSSLCSESSQGACHLSNGAPVQSHMQYTLCQQFMSGEALKHSPQKQNILEEACRGANIIIAGMHTHMHKLFPPSELIRSHGNMKVIKQSVKGKRERERQIQRGRKTNGTGWTALQHLYICLHEVFRDAGCVCSGSILSTSVF